MSSFSAPLQNGCISRLAGHTYIVSRDRSDFYGDMEMLLIPLIAPEYFDVFTLWFAEFPHLNWNRPGIGWFLLRVHLPGCTQLVNHSHCSVFFVLSFGLPGFRFLCVLSARHFLPSLWRKLPDFVTCSYLFRDPKYN